MKLARMRILQEDLVKALGLNGKEILDIQFDTEGQTAELLITGSDLPECQDWEQPILMRYLKD